MQTQQAEGKKLASSAAPKPNFFKHRSMSRDCKTYSNTPTPNAYKKRDDYKRSQLTWGGIYLDKKEKSDNSSVTDCEEDAFKEHIILLRPLYRNSPPTVVFDYPDFCELPSRVNARCFKLSKESIQTAQVYFRISKKAHTYNCVVNACRMNGVQQTFDRKFNIFIDSGPKNKTTRKLKSFQKYNHFPGAWSLGRKDNLWKNIQRMYRQYGEAYNIAPYTYIFPDDFQKFESHRLQDPKGFFIKKPAASSCGRGIKVINGKSRVSKKSGYILQKYIPNPHLIMGLKYDLRLYVCVTCFNPLRIYLYREGLVRFATQKYSTDSKLLQQRFVHLTNYSVNKKAQNYVQNSGCDQNSSKWPLSDLIAYFKKENIDWDQVLQQIQDVIIKTLISVETWIVSQSQIQTKNYNNCFELYGFDILLDSNLKPWLLEVNVSPSLSSGSKLDKKLKTQLMCDVFTLIGISPINRKSIKQEYRQNKKNRLLGISMNRATNRNVNQFRTGEISISEDDLQMLIYSQEELYRKGNFNKIFPLKENVETYQQFFTVERFNNLLLWYYLLQKEDILEDCIESDIFYDI